MNRKQILNHGLIRDRCYLERLYIEQILEKGGDLATVLCWLNIMDNAYSLCKPERVLEKLDSWTEKYPGLANMIESWKEIYLSTLHNG